MPANAVTLDVEVGGYFYRPAATSVRAPHGKVVLRFHQTGAKHHEAILFRVC
ncbi:hypothetical protein AB0F52_21370 [Amycolatopsis sp. NPDC024027]|uniref:hypothetical protein n=1 Tax=Amycolatopsis sp. NPDC024027 TaxID=3154327 RepID=UPI0033D2D1BE